jgi:tetratricopeptide (TPR) repeat protein/O-antigen ligase
MTTKLGAWCEGAIQAGWLAALVAVPLLLNVNSISTFELDKIALLRTIVLGVALASAVAWSQRRRSGTADRRDRRPPDAAGARVPRSWLAIVLAYCVILAAATALSIEPRVSFWGSLERAQGLYTTAAYVVFHLSVLAWLRRRDQMDALVTTVVLVSLPVAVYGIGQHAGADPITWLKDVSTRVASTLGNPIFAGAFLVLVVPPTLFRLFESFGLAARGETDGIKRILAAGGVLNLAVQVSAWWMGPAIGAATTVVGLGIWTMEGQFLRKPLPAFVRLAAYSAILSAQLACLSLSQSRGPWLGLAAALFVFGLGWAVAHRRPRTAVAIGGSGLAAAVLLAAFTIADGSREPSREGRYIGRFAGMAEGTGRVRLLVWDATVRLMASDPFRAIVGYGPETMKFVSAPYLPPEIGHVEQRGARADRAHNETLDAWFISGLPGTGIYLTLFAAVFLGGLTAAGLAKSRAERTAFLLTLAACGAMGVFGCRLVDGSWRLAGVMLPLGMYAGLCSYLVWRAVSGAQQSEVRGLPQRRADALALSLLAAVAGHFVESQFGIAVSSTRLYFWLFAALLVAAPLVVAERERNGEPARELLAEPVELPWRALVTPCIVITLMLATLIYDFSFVGAPVMAESAFGLIALTWALGGAIAAAEAWLPIRAAVPGSLALATLAIYAAVTLTAAMIFTAGHAAWVRAAPARADVPLLLYVFVAAVLAAASILLRPAGATRRVATRAGWLAPIAAAVLVVVAWQTNLQPVRANIYYKDAVAATGEALDPVASMQRAVDVQPRESLYHAALAEVLAIQGLRSESFDESAALFARAERSLDAARAASPREDEHDVHLARLYVRWGAREPDAKRQAERWNEALSLYRTAVARTPGRVVLLNELGAAELLMGKSDAALDTLRRSLQLDDRFAETHLRLASVYQRRGETASAAQAFQAATALVPPERLELIRALTDRLMQFESPVPAVR